MGVVWGHSQGSKGVAVDKHYGWGYVSEVGPRLRLQREIEEPQLSFLTRVLSFRVKKDGWGSRDGVLFAKDTQSKIARFLNAFNIAGRM